ncbi:MAG: MFS transporter [Bacillota bacterium]|nr:MFS transporter [Bacillota bacterium]
MMDNGRAPGAERLFGREFLLSCTGNLLNFMSFHMLLATFAYYVIALGGDQAVAGFVSGIFAISSTLMRPFAGWILDHRGRRGILLAGMLGMVLLPLGYALCSLLILAIALRFFHGLTWAASSTALNTHVCDIIPRSRFAEGMGYFGLTAAISTALAPALGLALMRNGGFTLMFCASAAVAAVALLSTLTLKYEALPLRKQHTSLRELLRGLFNKDALPASLTMFFFLFPYGAITTFIALYAEFNGLGGGGAYFMLLAAMTALMRVLGGRVADRRGEGLLVYISVICGGAAMLLLWQWPSQLSFCASALLFGCGFGLMTPTMQAMAMRISTAERRGSASSTYLCAFDIGIGLGGITAGLLAKYLGYASMYGVISLGLAVSLLVYVLWARRSPSSFRNAAK